MFTDTARFYDAIYGFKDYARESENLLDLLSDHVGGTLLDVACGTGKHIEHLSQKFICEGVDLDESLLEVARTRLPSVPFHQGDMTDFDLGKQFDAVTCLFSAIGYAETVEGLGKALGCFAKHTKPGGMVIVEPWFSVDQWVPGRLHAMLVDEPDLKITRMSLPGREGTISTLQFEYLILSPAGFERASEMHRLGLFEQEEYLAAFAQAGLDARHVEGGLMGRGLYVGIKPN